MTGSLFGDNEEMIKWILNLGICNLVQDVLELEKASLGFYVSGHPLDEYENK